MAKQFTKGKPVWYVNKRTKKVYAGVYHAYFTNPDCHLVFTRSDTQIILDDCLFESKASAMVALTDYLEQLINHYENLSHMALTKQLDLAKRTRLATDEENKAYKRLYARYVDWSGDR